MNYVVSDEILPNFKGDIFYPTAEKYKVLAAIVFLQIIKFWQQYFVLTAIVFLQIIKFWRQYFVYRNDLRG